MVDSPTPTIAELDSRPIRMIPPEPDDANDTTNVNKTTNGNKIVNGNNNISGNNDINGNKAVNGNKAPYGDNADTTHDANNTDNVMTFDSTPHGDEIIVTHINTRSNRMKALQRCIRVFKPHLITPKGKSPAGSVRLEPPKRCALQRCEWREQLIRGTWLYDVTCIDMWKQAAQPRVHARKHVYYIAGGSWQDPPSFSHWRLIGALARRLPNSTITLISTPLAPQSPASQAMPHLYHVYKELMHQSYATGEKVIWAGDSSGGNMALALVYWSLAGDARTVPAAVMVICPATDLRHMDPRIAVVEKKDPLMSLKMIQKSAEAWAATPAGGMYKKDPMPMVGGTKYNLIDPRISPINAKLEQFKIQNVQVHGVTAGYDVLTPEAETFREELGAKGVSGKWLQWDKQMHCFPLAHGAGLKESNEALDWIIEVLKSS